MGEGAPLVIKRARHPLLEAQGEASVVPNDVALTHATNFQLITGPNMSGKSTYLRQTALITLLAHIGCHVPAEAATIPLLHRVFTRIGSSDSLESNGSTFACEMRETTYILRNLSKGPSLVLVDELGRGTSNRDGASLAWAIAEQLALSRQSFTLFATHYLQLANLRNLYPSHVRTLVLDTQQATNRLRFLYNVREGVASKRQYMTDFLAEVAGVPPTVCATAKALSASIDFDPVDTPSNRTTTLKAYTLVAERLIWLRRSTTMDEQSMRTFLIDLKGKLKTELAKHEHLHHRENDQQQRSLATAASSARCRHRSDRRTHPGYCREAANADASAAAATASGAASSASAAPEGRWWWWCGGGGGGGGRGGGDGSIDRTHRPSAPPLALTTSARDTLTLLPPRHHDPTTTLHHHHHHPDCTPTTRARTHKRLLSTLLTPYLRATATAFPPYTAAAAQTTAHSRLNRYHRHRASFTGPCHIPRSPHRPRPFPSPPPPPPSALPEEPQQQPTGTAAAMEEVDGGGGNGGGSGESGSGGGGAEDKHPDETSSPPKHHQHHHLQPPPTMDAKTLPGKAMKRSAASAAASAAASSATAETGEEDSPPPRKHVRFDLPPYSSSSSRPSILRGLHGGGTDEAMEEEAEDDDEEEEGTAAEEGGGGASEAAAALLAIFAGAE